MNETLNMGLQAAPEKYLAHLITEEERTHFEEQGYLYVQNALTTEMRDCLLYTSPSPRDRQKSRMPSSA